MKTLIVVICKTKAAVKMKPEKIQALISQLLKLCISFNTAMITNAVFKSFSAVQIYDLSFYRFITKSKCDHGPISQKLRKRFRPAKLFFYLSVSKNREV